MGYVKVKRQKPDRKYLDSLEKGQVITICDNEATGHTYVDWISDIRPHGFVTGKRSLFSRRTGYILGAGAPEREGYILQFVYEDDGKGN